MNLYGYLKFLHVLAAFWFVAGIIGRQLVRTLAQSSKDIGHFESMTQVAGKFETLMVIPGNFVVIVVGVLAAWVGGWPIFGFLQGAPTNWLLATNLILIAGILIVPTIYLPRGKIFDLRLQEARAVGTVTPALIAALRDPVVQWSHRGEVIGLVIIIALMVLKPF